MYLSRVTRLLVPAVRPAAVRVQAAFALAAHRSVYESERAFSSSPRISVAARKSKSMPLYDNLPYEDLKRKYQRILDTGEVPSSRALTTVLRTAMKNRDQAFWEGILNNDVPRFKEKVEAGQVPNEVVSHFYVRSAWSQAIYAYSDLGDIAEAMVFFHRLVDVGTYPLPNAVGKFLVAVKNSSDPLPVLPQGWAGEPCDLYGVRAAYPPQGATPEAKFIEPESPEHRARLLAEMGKAMLYAELQNDTWPIAFMYNVVMSLQVHAGMFEEVRELFETSVPTIQKAMPSKGGLTMEYMQTAVMWTMAIRCAEEHNEPETAERWLEDYRATVIPMLREIATRYKDKEVVAMFALHTPFYAGITPQRPRGEDGIEPTPWYDLHAAKRAMERDALRIKERLPIAYWGAHRMLRVFADIDELRDMKKAEVKANTIQKLYEDPIVPTKHKPAGFAELAMTWKYMVRGYLALAAQHQKGTAGADAMPLEQIKERLGYWFGEWNAAFEKAEFGGGGITHANAALSWEDRQLARSLLEIAAPDSEAIN
ncbi:hypothetical protein GGF46_001216 [Coemansia sp. RSA 552]|nr:hypothetical protein GGF46_001216 [Coemansia sp. RSA 552]